MRLVLKLAAPWTEAAPGAGEALAFTCGDLPLRLYTTALYDRFAPPSHTSENEIVGELDVVSALGWPVHVIERAGAASLRELEARYAFFELCGSVVITGPAASIARDRDALLAAALAGRPDWAGDIACISELLA
ncbi:MAG TPA: hypothetical protein VGG28_32925 [Kofleriaceae bacterium]|jgi:hypothetical protein